MQGRKRLHISYGFLVIFLFLFCYKSYWNDLPRGLHQWANADRYAVSVRYLEDRAFLNPATQYMNAQDGAVGCEFPLLQYSVAQLVKLGFPKQYQPFLYRSINFIFFSFAFYVLLFKMMKHEWNTTRLLIYIGLFCSPVLLFYSYNFLTDIFSLGLVLFAFSLFEEGINKNIIRILLVLFLATLIKTLAGVYLIAFIGLYVLQNIKKVTGKKLLIVLLGMVFIGLIAYYDYYYFHLRNKEAWSWVFMSSPRHIESFKEFIDFGLQATRWKIDYFNIAQYVVLLIAVVFAIWNWKKINNQLKQLYALLFIGFIGIYILFGIQFIHHDYYIISSFLPAVLYFLVKSIGKFLEYIPPKTSVIFAALFAVVSFTLGSQRNYMRISETFHIDGQVEKYEYQWLEGIDTKISPYVNSDELIAVTHVNEPNHSLVYLKRKGFTFNNEEIERDEKNFLYWMSSYKVMFFICRNENLSHFAQYQPTFLQNSVVVHTFDEFTLYKVNGY